MRTHNIQLHDKIRIFPEIVVFWIYRKNFIWIQKIYKAKVLTSYSALRYKATAESPAEVVLSVMFH